MNERFGMSNVAVVFPRTLGDSLIFLLLVENLRLNGINATCFGDLIHDFKNWVPGLNTEAYPAQDRLDGRICQFDSALIWAGKGKSQNYSELPVTSNYLFLANSSPAGARYDFIIEEYKSFTCESMVDRAISFISDVMGLHTAIKNVELSPPRGLIYMKNRKRVVVSPDSGSNYKKNWDERSYLKLCDELSKAEYDPKIVVAPQNNMAWRKKVDGRFEVPLFDNIDELASYIFESACVISNDSGNGHLASFLDIPTVTIHGERDPNFHWRPGWRTPFVVTPRVVLKIPFQPPIWRPFIRVGRIVECAKAAIG